MEVALLERCHFRLFEKSHERGRANESPGEFGARLRDDLLQCIDDIQKLRPLDNLPAPQRRRLRRPRVRRDELLGVAANFVFLLPDRPAEILRGRWATEPHADSQFFAGRYQHVRIEQARAWFGLLAELRVNATQAALVQEYARSVRPVFQAILAAPRRAERSEHRLALKLRSFGPFLFFDTLLLLVRHRHEVLTAAVPTLVATPVLNDGKLADGEVHSDPF